MKLLLFISLKQSIIVYFILIWVVVMKRNTANFQKINYDSWSIKIFEKSNLNFSQASRKCQVLKGQLAILKTRKSKHAIKKQISESLIKNLLK